jgi:hypothetical protein
MTPLFSVDLESKSAYVSYRPSVCVARQVRVMRGRSGRLGAVPCGPALDGIPSVIAEYDAAGDIVGLQIYGLSLESLGLADEFLELVDLPLPTSLARTISASETLVSA